MHLFKDCPFKHKKKCHILPSANDTNSHTADLEGEIVEKKKKKSRYNTLLNKHQLKKNKEKYINTCLNNKKIKFQIDTGSDLTIINAETWKKVKCPTLSNSKKIARGVTGEKFKFMGETFVNAFFNGKERKLKAFVLRNVQNSFGTDWMEEFDQFNVPINTFRNKIDGTTTNSDKLKKK